MTPGQKKGVAFIAGSLAGIHAAVKQLEADGVEGLDPVACAMEDMGDLLVGILTGVSDAESSATNR